MYLISLGPISPYPKFVKGRSVQPAQLSLPVSFYELIGYIKETLICYGKFFHKRSYCYKILVQMYMECTD